MIRVKGMKLSKSLAYEHCLIAIPLGEQSISTNTFVWDHVSPLKLCIPLREVDAHRLGPIDEEVQEFLNFKPNWVGLLTYTQQRSLCPFDHDSWRFVPVEESDVHHLKNIWLTWAKKTPLNCLPDHEGHQHAKRWLHFARIEYNRKSPIPMPWELLRYYRCGLASEIDPSEPGVLYVAKPQQEQVPGWNDLRWNSEGWEWKPVSFTDLPNTVKDRFAELL